MSSRPFVHLHCHSHYSLLDGASKIPALVQRAKGLGMEALALDRSRQPLWGRRVPARGEERGDQADHRARGVCRARGVGPSGPAAGASGKETSFHLTLLARTGAGVRNLIRLSSMSFLEGFYYKPRIDKEILERHAEGLICLSGCVSSEFSDHILHGKRAEAERSAPGIRRCSVPRTSIIEIQDNGVSDPARTRGGGR